MDLLVRDAARDGTNTTLCSDLNLVEWISIMLDTKHLIQSKNMTPKR